MIGGLEKSGGPIRLFGKPYNEWNAIGFVCLEFSSVQRGAVVANSSGR